MKKSQKSATDRRRFPVGHDPRRERRRMGAEERDALRAARSVEEQLALIAARPGESRRERERLSAI